MVTWQVRAKAVGPFASQAGPLETWSAFAASISHSNGICFATVRAHVNSIRAANANGIRLKGASTAWKMCGFLSIEVWLRVHGEQHDGPGQCKPRPVVDLEASPAHLQCRPSCT